MSINKAIVQAMTDLEEDALYAEVKKELDAGTDKMSIIASLQEGMTKVGDLFSANKYFLSELMMSAELFGICQDMMGGEDAIEAKYGCFLIGTVYGDVHDIGKNIVVAVMRSNGFKVIDLGVDVRPEAFIAAVKEHNPKVIGFSCLLTTAFDSMKDCIKQLRDSGLSEGRLLLIGGGPVEEGTVKYVNADAMCKTPQDGLTMSIAHVTKA